MRRSMTAALVAIVAAIAVGAGPALDAHAADEPSGLITWSVKPADENGRDGRAWVERDVDPGQRVAEHLAVTNFGDTAVTFRLSAADGYFTDTGRFTILPASQPSREAGTWIDIPKSVQVAGGATEIVPFTITVPEDAIPGDNAAGVAASVFSSGADASGTQVGVESRVGFRVMLRVSGALDAAFDVVPETSAYDVSWNPLRPGSVTVAYDLVNEGNTRLLLSDNVDASGRFGSAAVPNAATELLPGDVRRVERTVTGVWPIGLVRVVVGAEGTVTPGDAAAGSVERQIWVWAIPFPQLAFLVGAALLIAAFVWRRRRTTAEIERRLDEARRQTEQAVRDELKVPETRA